MTVPASKALLREAITIWAAQRITTGGLAPLFIIMLDHGSPGIFHLAAEEVTPGELDGWLGDLEKHILENLGQALTTVLINGSCYSGSFINALSRQGRIIVTSSAVDQESVQGPSTATTTYGEYFVYYLLSGLAGGKSLAEAFTGAAGATELVRPCDTAVCRSEATGPGRPGQTPLLDDNGDGRGSRAGRLGEEDGNVASGISLGLGTNPGALGWTQVAATTVTMIGEPPPVVFAQTSDATRTVASWVEVRKPSYRTPAKGGTAPILLDLARITGWYDEAAGRWHYDLGASHGYTGLDEAGTYTLYYYALAVNGDILPPATGRLYVNSLSNHSPDPPVLLTPASDEEVREAVMIFRWHVSRDPESDPVTYTIRVHSDDNGTRGSELTRFEAIPEEGYFVRGTAEKTSDGNRLFFTGACYHWDVEATDDKGASARSESRRFCTTFTNSLGGLLYGYITDGTTKKPITGAFVRAGAITVPSLTNGYYLLPLTSPGSFVIATTAQGYSAAEPLQLSVSAGAILRRDFSLARSGFSLFLAPGWNFVSIPFDPADRSIDAVFADQLENVRIIWGFDNEQKKWRIHIPRDPAASSLVTLDPAAGYWIYMERESTLLLKGGAVRGQKVTLYPGWNLVGFAGEVDIDSSTALLPIDEEWKSLWTWSGGVWSLRHKTRPAVFPLLPLEVRKRGNAYWLWLEPGGEIDWPQ